MEQILSFLPLLLIFGVMYLVLIVPQQRQKKKHSELLNSLTEGDEVILNSGIHGFVGQLEKDVVWLEVASDLELKVSRSAIAGKVDVQDEVAVDDHDDDDADQKEANEKQKGPIE